MKKGAKTTEKSAETQLELAWAETWLRNEKKKNNRMNNRLVFRLNCAGRAARDDEPSPPPNLTIANRHQLIPFCLELFLSTHLLSTSRAQVFGKRGGSNWSSTLWRTIYWKCPEIETKRCSFRLYCSSFRCSRLTSDRGDTEQRNSKLARPVYLFKLPFIRELEQMRPEVWIDYRPDFKSP